MTNVPDFAITQFADDVCRVVNTVRLDADGDYGAHGPPGKRGVNIVLDTALRAVLRTDTDTDPGQFLENVPALEKLTRWVMFTTQFNAKYRPLTPAEQELQKAAERLYDSIHNR